jgi:two-component system OmpR family sensor kinase
VRFSTSSLRFRLLAISTALALAGMIVVNVVAWVTLSSTLLDRVDAELMSVPSAPVGGVGQSTPPAGTEPAGGATTQFLSNHVITRLDGATGAVLSQMSGPVLTGAPQPDLASYQTSIRDGAPVTTELVTLPGIGDPGYHYRARALTSVPGEVVVVAVSLADVEATIARVRSVDAVVSALVIAALIGVGVPSLRVGLRPLTEVESAAEHIAAGDDTVRAPHDGEPTEVGSLARAFNLMVDKMVGALGAASDSEDRLRRFLADASHELRTPLTSIRAYAELFGQGVFEVDPPAREAIGRIEAEAIRMGVLVEDLLLLARLDQQRALIAEDVEVDALAADVAADVAATAPDHVVTVSVRGAVPVIAVGDELGLRQVVRNLVRNAVVHTPPGTRVDVSVTAREAEVVVVVRDDGLGMSEDAAAHVFERFYRPDEGRSRAVAGTGLGLAIVESIVTAHHGTVSVRTSPGHGATFTVVLPGVAAS